MVGRVVSAATAASGTSPITTVIVPDIMSSGIIDPPVITHIMSGGIIDPPVITDIMGGGIVGATRELGQRVVRDTGRALAALVVGDRTAGTLTRGDRTGVGAEGGIACASGKGHRGNHSKSENTTGHDKPPKK
jgi:hypothetical protein